MRSVTRTAADRLVRRATVLTTRRQIGFDPSKPHTAETKWDRALEAFAAKCKTATPTRRDVVALSRDVLNRHVRSSVMGYASQSLRAEFHVPLAVVVGLARLAADVKRHEHVTAAAAAALAPGQKVNTTPDTDDSYHQLFDAAMRHVSMTTLRRSRTSQFFGDQGDRIPGVKDARLACRDDAPSFTHAETDVSVWSAAIAVMSNAHYCGVLQHDYDGPAEDLRINGTSRIWRNFTVAMSSECIGDGPGRSAWENALTLLAYMTPVPFAKQPPCCGFTSADDEFGVTRAVEECLGREGRRDEFLTWFKYVRSTDHRVTRHVCGTAPVCEFAAKVAARRSLVETRDPWGVQQDLKGDLCVTSLLCTVAPNAAKAAITPDVAPGVHVAASNHMPFVDRTWRYTDSELVAVDAALTAATRGDGSVPTAA